MFELRVQNGVEPHSFCIGCGIFAASLQNLSSNSPHKKLRSRSQSLQLHSRARLEPDGWRGVK